jgi:very-short-patch-repair endonuclease
MKLVRKKIVFTEEEKEIIIALHKMDRLGPLDIANTLNKDLVFGNKISPSTIERFLKGTDNYDISVRSEYLSRAASFSRTEETKRLMSESRKRIIGNGFIPFESYEERKVLEFLEEKNFVHTYIFHYGKSRGVHYLLDFFNEYTSVNIEIDGWSHYSQEAQESDNERDSNLSLFGVRVVRIWIEEVSGTDEIVQLKELGF